MQSISSRASEIRDRVMSTEDIDIRQEVADLCDLVADLAAEVERVRASAYQAANTASCLANGIKPD